MASKSIAKTSFYKKRLTGAAKRIIMYIKQKIGGIKNKIQEEKIAPIYVSVCLMSMLIGAIAAEAYVSKTVTGIYRTDFVPGIAKQGSEKIYNAGIGFLEPSYYANVTIARLKRELKDKEVVLIHSHGDAGYVTLTSTTKVSGTAVASWTDSISSKLVYLSSCSTGAISSTYGNLPYELVQKGIGTVVSFKGNISATTTTNGIHRFNLLAITNMTNGYSVSQSMALAYTTFKGMCTTGNYYGADTYKITGNGDYYMRHM